MPPTHRLVRQAEGVLLPRVEIANTLFSRARGLMGRAALSPEEALWIPRCRAIHTCWMQVPMDAVFVDRQMRVVDVLEMIVPFRFPRPSWRAWGVLELRAGRCRELNIRVGDQLALERSDDP